MEVYANKSEPKLSGGINNSVTSITIVGSTFPSTSNFRILIDSEIMLVTNVSGTTFTVTRGVDGTAGASHADSSVVTSVLTKTSLLNLIKDRTTLDTLANEPVASRAGNLYLPTDAQQQILLDNGSSWNLMPMMRSSKYPPFTVTGVSDEFDDNNFSGWTLVDDGSNQPTVIEKNDVMSILLPGGDPSAHIHSFMKTATVSTNDYIEICFRGWGIQQNFNIIGLVFADGTTYNSGNQAFSYASTIENVLAWGSFTGFNSWTDTSFTALTSMHFSLNMNWFMRMKYNGSNSYTLYTSPDGISWQPAGTWSVTLTPSAVGFAVTTWSGSNPFQWTIEYFKKGP